MKKFLLYLLMWMSVAAFAAEAAHPVVFLPVQSYDPEIPQELITGCRRKIEAGLLARGIKPGNADAAIYALTPEQRQNLALLSAPDYLKMSDSSGAEKFIQLTIGNYSFFLRSVYVVECSYYTYLAVSTLYGHIRVISETGDVLGSFPLDLSTAYRRNSPTSAAENVDDLLDAVLDEAVLDKLAKLVNQPCEKTR